MLEIILILSLSCISYANYYIKDSVKVNKEELPEIDEMYNVSSDAFEMLNNESGPVYDKNSNGGLQTKLGISLLTSELASENPYVIEKIQTDNKDYAILTFKNYILGDTSNYHYNKEEGYYDYMAGKEYYSPILLEVDIMLSEEQMRRGWDAEYLGGYQFKEQYVSKQGYKVNIIEGTQINNQMENYISEKNAIFVADGIRYTLRGRTSIENIKNIVDTMEYKN